MATQKKIETVQKIKEKLEKARMVVLLDYQGLTHRQMEDFRRLLKKVRADFMVVKNSLLKLALKQTPRIQHTANNEEVSPGLIGSTAALFAFEEEIAPLRELARFIKSLNLPKVKIGLWGEKILNAEEVLRLASLPSREVLISQTVAGLKSPLFRINYAMKYNLVKLAIILKLKSQNSNKIQSSILRQAQD